MKRATLVRHLPLLAQLAAAPVILGQVSMPVSPTIGSPVSMLVDWDPAQTNNTVLLVMGTPAGQVQNSCYLTLTLDSQGMAVTLHRTETSTPGESYSGYIGGAPWYAPSINSNACGVHLNNSSYSTLSGTTRRVSLSIDNGIQPYFKQVVANYTPPCAYPPGSWQCWFITPVSQTIGQWDASPAAPVISQVAATPTSNAATITWQTSLPTTTKIEWGTTQGVYTGSTTMDPALVYSHSATTPNAPLTSSTTYYFRVSSQTGSQVNYTATGQFTTQAGQAPVISQVVATPTSNSATITWQTSVPTTTKIEWGTQAGVYTGSTTMDPALVSSHSATTACLPPSTLHYFRVSSQTQSQVNHTATGQFTTLAGNACTRREYIRLGGRVVAIESGTQ